MPDEDQTTEEMLPPEQQVGVKWHDSAALSISSCPVIESCQVILIPSRWNCSLSPLWSTTRGKSRLECKFYEQLEGVLSSSAPSAVPEVTYDVEEVIDDDDGEEDLQFVSQTNRVEIGTVLHIPDTTNSSTIIILLS